MLSEKVCLVVGGANGLGRATAETLGGYDATVVVSDLGTSVHGEGEDPEAAEEAAAAVRDAGGEAMAHHGDVREMDDVETLVEDAVAEYGRIDGAVNFAGILQDSILHRMTEAEFDRVVDVHLKGHFCLLRTLAAHWHERASDEPFDAQRSFLGVSSRSALGHVGQANYAAAKAGVLGLIRTAARELERDDVRANAMLPTAYTRMIEDVPADERPFAPEDRPPERVAEFVAYHVSDAATDVTGCTFWTGGDGMALVSDPEADPTAFREGGWTADAIADRVDETLGAADDLHRTHGVL